MCRHSANLGDLQGRAARSLLDITEECFYPFLNRFYQFLTTPQMHLVNIQCDNAPERALHLTGEEEEEEVWFSRPIVCCLTGKYNRLTIGRSTGDGQPIGNFCG